MRTCFLTSGGRRRWEGGADAYRGGEGPLTVETSRYQDPLIDAYLKPGATPGIRRPPTTTAPSRRASRRIQMTIRDGHRCSAAVGYLRPALGAEQSAVETGALVTRIVFEGTRAVGVEYLQNGERKVARAEREMILAGGAVNSPQTLMLSGVGDPDELARARHRDESAAARRRQELAGSPGGAHYLCAHRAWAVAAEHAARSHRAQRRRRGSPSAKASPPACRAASRRFSRATPARTCPTCSCCSSPGRCSTRGLISRRSGSRSTTASAAASWCCGPQARGTISLKSADPGAGAAHRAEPARHRSRQTQDPRGGETVPRDRRAQGAAAVREGGNHSRCREAIRRRARCRDPRHRRHGASPGRKLPHGRGRDARWSTASCACTARKACA